MISSRQLRLRFLFALLLAVACGMTGVFASSGAESSKSLWIDAPRTRLNTYGDALQPVLGPAHLSHADEYAAIMRHVDELGVPVTTRRGTLAYEPSLTPGSPGRLILDPDASIGALRHEYRHVLDDFDLGHPGFRVMGDSDQFWRLEFRGYMEEINAARAIRDYDAGRAILQEMRQRRLDILGK